MVMLNIGAANKDDAFYRYKMPKMITKIEGRGNGIKTNIVNMVDIAKALGRPGSYITKYFGCQLGAQSKFDDKTGTSHVNGSHQTAKLASLLENFIKKYVQCYGCGNPETEIIISKSQMITLKCAACGFLSDVDMEDKLKRLIVKNPHEQKKGKDKKAMRRAELERLKEGEVADEELKKMAAKGSLKKTFKKEADVSDEESHSEEEAEEEDDDNVQWQTDTSEEAARLRIKEQLSAVTAGMVMLSTTEEKPKSYQKNLVDEIKSQLKKTSSVSQVKSYLDSLSCDPQETMNAFFEALFDGVGKGFSKEVTKKKNYIAAVTQEEGSQLLLLHAIEAFCFKGGRSEVVKEVALVLKALYDDDLMEEEFIVQWFNKGLAGNTTKGSPIWKNVKPFVEWLPSAQSESEEE